jgi:GDPmannose 4,6-dehydratase
LNRAIVVGSDGQDGRLLFDRLERDGRDVVGIGRRGSRRSDGREFRPIDITDGDSVAGLVAEMDCDVFFLPAVHQSSEAAAASDEPALFDKSWQVHVQALVNFLDAMSRRQSGALFYAASSHVFGDPDSEPQSEATRFKPETPYAITKAAGVFTCRYYRRAHSVRASSGILFNHESPLRDGSYLSRKITSAAARISREGKGELVIGSLSARNDWGYAPDFVDAMIRITRLPDADDFVVATGETHTVEEFAAIAFDHVGLDWRDHVIEDNRVLTRPPSVRVGDPTRLRQATGWKPTVSFDEMVRLLVDAAVEGS